MAESNSASNVNSSDVCDSAIASCHNEKEYEAQFFGFTPKSFVDGVYNAFQSYLEHAIDSVRQCLMGEFQQKFSEAEIEVAVKLIRDSIQCELEKRFDNFEIFAMKEIFNIPANIVLPEDKAHIQHPNDVEEEKEICGRIEALEDDIKVMKYVTAKMEKELETIAAVQKFCDRIRESVVSIHQQFREEGVDDIKEMVMFLSQQMHQLGSLRNEIIPLPEQPELENNNNYYNTMHHQIDPSVALQIVAENREG